MIAPIKPDKWPLKKVNVLVKVNPDGTFTHKILDADPLQPKKKKPKKK